MDQATSVEQRGLTAFVAEASSIILRRRMLVPALLLLVVLTGSNIVILLNLPEQQGSLPPLPFLIAAFVRLAGLVILSSAILRIGAPSERSVWRLDGGFWLYALSIVFSLAVSAGNTILLGEKTDPWSLAMRSAISLAVLAPFCTWFAGMNVATPLGWRPRRFMRDFRRWLPHLIFWSLLLITPLGVIHALIDLRLIGGVDELFWPLALLDGALSTVLAFTGFGLSLAAYRRVAPD